jgi:hypothetical protein
VLGLEIANDAALLWMQVLLVWAGANYLTFADPSDHEELEELRRHGIRSWRRRVYERAAAAGLITLLLPGLHARGLLPRIALAALVLAGCLLLPLTRLRVVAHKRRSRTSGAPLAEQHGFWLAEWEAAVNAAVAVLSWILVRQGGLGVRPWIVLPGTSRELTVVSGCAALVLGVAGGGSFIVRGLLNKAGALPRQPDASGAASAREEGEDAPVDAVEFSRGRIIGVLERVIVLVLMAVQAYQAIAFLMAAKGLIRSKDLESRDFAEYFLIGTLASMALALAGGVTAQLLLKCWP